MEIDDLITKLHSLDELNPIERYKLRRELHDNDYFYYLDKLNIYLGDAILLGLYAIESVIRKKTTYDGYIYIRNDQSVKNLLEQVTKKKINEGQFQSEMVWIDQTKLIYRFTCALKFEVNDVREKQLRINSWGRIYMESILKNTKLNTFYLKLTEFVERIYTENEETYNEILKLLLVTKNNFNTVNQLNKKLNIKLLA